MAVGQKAVVTNAMEAIRQYVEEKTAHDTPIGSLSPTVACSISMRPTSTSAGRTTGRVVVTRAKSCG
jgi:hypothetical protein